MTTTAAIVLAAGLGKRFGGGKLLARLDGKPLLQHVLDLAAETDLVPVVVVLGRDADELRRAMNWRAEDVLLNLQPERGLASSLQRGLAHLGEAAPAAQRVLILLGDQPRLGGAHILRLLEAPLDAAHPIVVPRYADGRPGNPVLLERPAWPLAARISGDRGMSQLFEAHPELVRYVDLPGLNPDVDTPTDLAQLNRQ